MASNYTYKYIVDEYGQIVYPRTVLSAIDLITANGIQVSNDTIFVQFATKEQIRNGAYGQVVSADGLKEAIAAYNDTLYIAGGGIAIEGGTIFAKPAPVASLIKGTPNEYDAVTNANLNGAMEVGLAANMTPPLLSGVSTFTSASEYTEVTNNIVDNCLRLQKTSAANGTNYTYDWTNLEFVKSGSTYLIMADFKNNNSVSLRMNLRAEPMLPYTTTTTPSLSEQDRRTFSANSEWVRIANLFNTVKTARLIVTTTAAGNIDLRVKHFCIFDVTGLSNEAIYALATMEHPELYDKYLVKNDAVCPWMPIHDLGTQTVVSLEAGRAYKLTANDGNTHTITVNPIPENSYGKETHITILVGSTSNVVLKKPLSLMDPLIANAANNCVIKYRDGKAYLYVDDRDYGYVVTIASGGNVNGTMYYGLRTATDNYILISPALDGTPVNLESATGRAVSVVGNGVNKTILTGNVAPTATTDIHNATFRNVTVTGGQLVLNSDTKVESGSTVGVSGGSVAIKGSTIEPGATVRGVTSITSVTVDGTIVLGGHLSTGNCAITGTGVIDQNYLRIINYSTNTILSISGCTFTKGGAGLASIGACATGATATVVNTTLADTDVSGGDIGFQARTGGRTYLKHCVITRNRCTSTGVALTAHQNNAYLQAEDCVISYNYTTNDAIIIAAATCSVNLINCQIYGNTARSGAAMGFISHPGGKLYATNCVIYDNVSSNAGTGLYAPSNTSGITVSLTGCTFGNNQDISIAATSSILYLNGYNKFNAGINSSGTVSIASSAIVDINDSSSSIVGAPITIGDNVTLLTKRGRGRCNSCTCSVIDTSGGVTLSTCTGTTVTTGRNIVVNASKVWVGENISLNKGYAAAGGCFNVSGNAKVILTGSTISGCTATGTNGGGCFYIAAGSSVEISDALFTGCYAQSGAVAKCYGTLSISNAVIENNNALYMTLRGEAGSTISLANVIIRGNTNNDVGVAGYNTGNANTLLTMTDCYITNNLDQITSIGGIVYNSLGARVELVRTTITGNTSASGMGTAVGLNGSTHSYTDCFLDGGIYNRTSGAQGLVSFNGTNRFTGKVEGATTYLRCIMAAGSILDLSRNTNDTPINGCTVSALGTFTIVNRYGERHEYSARSVTGSTITNLGVWLPNPGRQSLTGTTDLIGYTLENITYNDAHGAAITTSGAGTKNLRNLTITGCSTTQYGAAVFVQTSGNTVNITDCTISYNLCGYGTIMASGSGSKTVVTHCKIFNNKCSGFGPAGQSWSGGNLTFIDCEIYGNSSGSGGTIMINNGVYLEARGCYFHDNIGSFPGVLAQGATTSISGCTFGSGQHITAQGASTIIKLSGTNILQEIGAAASVIQITTGAVIDLRGNNVATPIRGATITALGAFTVIDKNGSFHSYTATSKTNSTISNLGVWS